MAHDYEVWRCLLIELPSDDLSKTHPEVLPAVAKGLVSIPAIPAASEGPNILGQIKDLSGQPRLNARVPYRPMRNVQGDGGNKSPRMADSTRRRNVSIRTLKTVTVDGID